jgi:hypothetical protein
LKPSNYLKDCTAGVLCFGTLAASTYFRSDATVVVALSFLLVFFVAIFSLPKRQILPILFLVFLIKLLALPIAYILGDLDPFTYYLASAFVDLLMAFCIVFYHNDPKLLSLFKADGSRFVPQVYLMALVLAISSTISCVQSIEALMFVMDDTFYDDGPPLVSSHQAVIKQIIKILFDLSVCSLLLDPNRWKILQKIQNKFLAP